MLLMIDNYDSFTFNLVQYFGELGQDVRVFRNDEITLEGIAALKPDRLVLSPGPCSPAEDPRRWRNWKRGWSRSPRRSLTRPGRVSRRCPSPARSSGCSQRPST